MDIRQLKYFITIADCGSLSQASLALHVVQSALSHNLSQLENELETPLFHRKPRGVDLTEAGKILYDYAQSVLSTIEVAKKKIAVCSEEDRHQIWIGSNHTATHMMLPELPRTLFNEFPGVKIGYVEDLSSILISYLVEGKADLVLCYNPPDDLPLVVTSILEEPVCCVGTPDILPDPDTPIKFEEIMKMPLILSGQEGNMRGIMKQQKQAKQLEQSCIMEINSLPVLISVLKDGLGCSVLSAATIYREIEQGELVVRPIVDPEIKRVLCVAFSEATEHREILEKLSRHICTHIQRRIKERPVKGVALL